MTNNDEQLALEIEKAFENIEPPEDEHLVTNPNDWISEELVAEFSGKDWKDISEEFTYKHRLDLGYFTPQALYYYLPAFLVTSLRSTIDSPGDIQEFVFLSLLVSVNGRNLLESLINLFNEQQKNVVKQFFQQFMADNPSHKRNFEKEVEELLGE